MRFRSVGGSSECLHQTEREDIVTCVSWNDGSYFVVRSGIRGSETTPDYHLHQSHCCDITSWTVVDPASCSVWRLARIFTIGSFWTFRAGLEKYIQSRHSILRKIRGSGHSRKYASAR